MTRRSPNYARQHRETECGHAPEAHVVYDSVAARYLGEIRCSCQKLKVTSTQYHEIWSDADRDSKKLLAAAQLLTRMEL